MKTLLSRKLRGAALAAAVLGALAPPAGAATTQEIGESVGRSADWTIRHQNHTTGMVGAAANGNAAMGTDFSWSALAAAGYHLADIRDGKYPLSASDGSTNPTGQDYVQTHYSAAGWEIPFGGTGAKPVNEFSKATLFAYASGIDPRRITAAINTPAQIAATYNPATGEFSNGAPNVHGFALMALQQVGVPQAALSKAVDHLARQQHADGGFTFGKVTSESSYNARSDLDMTGVSLVALCQGGRTLSDQVVWRAVQFLRSNLQTNGSFYHMYGSNADSNGWAISGLNACNLPPQNSYWTSNGGNTPVDFLLSLQFDDAGNQATYGSYRYLPGQTAVNHYANQDALRALAGGTFSAEPPLRAVVNQPRWRTAPVVAAGTETPHVLTVDDGRNVRVCRVVAPAAATLDVFLQAARNTATPAGCLTDYAFEAGELTELNGARTDIDDGGWRVQRDGRAPAAATQATTIAFGDNVSLSLVSSGKGPKGDKGDDGANGADGSDGEAGAQGPQGIAGAQGPQGPAGLPGPAGPQGLTGSAGPAGRDGVVSFSAASKRRSVTRGRMVTLSFRVTNDTAAGLRQTTASARTPKSLRVSGKRSVRVKSIGAGKARTVRLKLRVGRTAKVGSHEVRVSMKVGDRTVTRTVTVRVKR